MHAAHFKQKRTYSDESIDGKSTESGSTTEEENQGIEKNARNNNNK